MQDGVEPVRHAVPMMSIDNTYSEDEVVPLTSAWRKQLGDAAEVEYVLEPEDRRRIHQPAL